MAGWRTSACGSALVVTALALTLAAPPASADHVALDPLEELGKFFFFDERLSTPRRRQGCVSCHTPSIGWVLPDVGINQTTVVAPGAQPRALGVLKAPSNAYAPRLVFRPTGNRFPPLYEGGNFWDGRSEGCATEGCQIGEFATETITADDIGILHNEFLGPTADQALNPTSRPGVEQNTRVQNVCQLVRTGPYADFFEEAWGEPISCSPTPRDNPAYETSFKRLAVAVAAYQASPDVNSFSSRRDACITKEADADGLFPCDNFSDLENRGHDIFYGIASDLNPAGTDARCDACHNSAQGEDPTGIFEDQTYADHGYHNIGVPFNPEIPTTAKGDIVGLSGHLGSSDPGVGPGLVKTPTLRNAAKGEGDIDDLFTKSDKAFMHNGYLKSLVQVVHFYNTSRTKPACPGDVPADEAILNDCWPEAEFPGTLPPPNIVGRLGLTCPDSWSDVEVNGQDICTVQQAGESEEEALVAYIRTLTDEHTPTAPDMSRIPKR